MSASLCVVRSSVSTERDPLWERTLCTLPDVLREALRSGELDDAGVLSSYPRSTVEELEVKLGVQLDTLLTARDASSDAASSRISTSTYGHPLQGRGLEWCGSVVGGDPRTDHASSVQCKGGDPITDHTSSNKGGVPKTDHATFVNEVGDPKTDHEALVRDRSGDPSTAPTCSPYRPGWLASATAFTLRVSPAQYPVSVNFPDSRIPDSEVSDGLLTLRESRDGQPSPADFQGSEQLRGSSLIDRCLERRFTVSESIGISRDFVITEKSEHLRQSQPGQVQNLPASVIPSELSAHQMGARSEDPLEYKGVDGHPNVQLLRGTTQVFSQVFSKSFFSKQCQVNSRLVIILTSQVFFFKKKIDEFG